jgi:hypothetical protein
MRTPRQIEAIEALRTHGSVRAAAEALGLTRSGFSGVLINASLTPEEKATLYKGTALNVSRARGGAVLQEAGYDLSYAEKTPEQAWREHASAFERKVGKQLSKADQVIERKGPFVIYHSTDQHIDDDASALSVLAQDIEASHGMGAIMCHGGDLLNNWPLAGKLAKQWAEQSCTLPDALLRAQHFISMFRPDVWVDGNHEEFNPYLVQLFEQWLPANVLRDYWRCDFTVKVPGGRDCRVALSHKFQKGSSWFHQMHGHLREMLQSEERHLYMDGHFHSDGVMHHSLPERGHSALLVASAGYKMVDKWASRISRGGKVPKVYGRAHWIVVDPYSEADMCHAFKCPEQAEVYFNGLQNLRAA